eukprot:958682-Prorocentrum_minimum.AAC.1
MRLVRRVYSGRLSSLWENERSPSHAALAREENNRNRARFACIDLSQLSRFPCPSFPSEGNRDDRGGQWTAQIRLDKAEGAVLGRAGPGKRAEIQPYWLPSECIAYLLTGLTRGLYYGTARRCPLQLSASAQRCSSAVCAFPPHLCGAASPITMLLLLLSPPPSSGGHSPHRRASRSLRLAQNTLSVDELLLPTSNWPLSAA